MNLQRMKFAWARGARLQWQTESGSWFTPNEPMPLRLCERIHPDDEHLAYGPLSSALRVPTMSKPNTMAHFAISVAWKIFDTGADIDATVDEWQTFAFFVAELLADEGL